MLHYVSSSELRSISGFGKLFDSENCFGLEAVKRVADSTELHLFRSIYKSLGKDRPLVGSGASIHRNKLRAALGALGESIERYSFASSHADFKNLSFLELRKRALNCLDPESFDVFAKEQRVVKQGEVIRLDRSSPIDWIWFDDALNRGEKILLPAQFNVLKNFKEPVYFLACTSGNACAVSESQARLGAALELLERDAFQLYWWTRNAPPQIDVSQPCARLKRILKPFQPELNKITLFLMETELQPSPVLVIFRGDPHLGEPAFAVSAACRMDPYEAIEKALHEIHHGLSSYRAGIELDPKADYKLDYEKSIWNFADHALMYAYTPMEKAYRFLFPLRPKKIPVTELKNFDLGSAQKNLQFIYKTFRQQKCRLYFRNGTSRDLRAAGIFASRAFSPDLTSIESIHRYRQLGVRRYYTVPKKLSWKSRPRRYSELNRYPHPFP